MRKLFVIMPFGLNSAAVTPDDLPIDFDTLYEDVIKPAGVAADFSVLRIDEVTVPGRISEQYLQELFSANLVVADVSVPNPNVFYELGIRHAMGSGPTVLIARRGTPLPFDIREQRTFFYDIPSQDNFRTAKDYLSGVFREASETIASNPVERFLHNIGAITSPTEDKGAFDQDLRGRIERARNVNQLIAVWNWAQQYKSLPSFTLAFLSTRLADEGEWATASEVVRRAIGARPNDYELYRYLGWYLRNLGEQYYGEAEEAFRTALTLNSSDPETIGMLAGLFKRQRRFLDAAQLYQIGASIAPSDVYMKVNRAAMELLANPQTPETALTLYRALLNEQLNLSPDKKDAWTEVLCAESYFVLGDDDASRKHFETAARLATSPTTLRSPADQIELFGSLGFRSDAARELAEWLRTRLISLQIPSPEPQVKRPVVDEVSVATPIILHLTDVHFGYRPGADGNPVRMHRFFDGDDSLTLEDHLLHEFISKKRHFSVNGRPVYIIVSGDFTYTATATEFAEALEFLEKLCTGMSVPKSHVVLCPGNHDVNWAHSRIDKTHRFDQYISFLSKFYGESFRSRYPLIKWDLTVDGLRPRPTDLISLQVIHEDGLLILSLNSCVYETEEHHYGYVSGRQLRACEELLEDNDLGTDLVRIAVVHHHLHPFPEPVKLETSGEHWHDQSTIRDSALVERFLEKHGFDLVLHGHKHKPQLRETLVRDPSFPITTRPLIVLGGGSCGVDSRELEHNVPNQYEVLEFVNVPRIRGADFLRIEWRTLDVAPGADWTTPRTWVLTG